MRWRITTNGRTERGAAAVEFALVVIPLLMVIAGIVNFGFVFAQQLALDNAVARRAARRRRRHRAPTPTTVATDQWNSTAIARSQTDPITVTYPRRRRRDLQGQHLRPAHGRHRAPSTSKFLIPWPLPARSSPDPSTLTSQGGVPVRVPVTRSRRKDERGAVAVLVGHPGRLPHRPLCLHRRPRSGLRQQPQPAEGRRRRRTRRRSVPDASIPAPATPSREQLGCRRGGARRSRSTSRRRTTRTQLAETKSTVTSDLRRCEVAPRQVRQLGHHRGSLHRRLRRQPTVTTSAIGQATRRGRARTPTTRMRPLALCSAQLPAHGPARRSSGSTTPERVACRRHACQVACPATGGPSTARGATGAPDEPDRCSQIRNGCPTRSPVVPGQADATDRSAR